MSLCSQHHPFCFNLHEFCFFWFQIHKHKQGPVECFPGIEDLVNSIEDLSAALKDMRNTLSVEKLILNVEKAKSDDRIKLVSQAEMSYLE